MINSSSCKNSALKRSRYWILTAAITVVASLTVPAVVPALAKDQLSPHSAEAIASPDQLLAQGLDLYYRDRLTEAVQVWQQALVAYRESESLEGEGSVLANLGIAYRVLGNYAKAIDYYQQALALNQTLDNPHRTRRILGNLGNVHAIIGQYRQALGYQQSSLDIARKLQDRAGERTALANLGATHADDGNHDLAIRYYQESLTLSQTMRDRASESFVLCNLGSAHNIWKKDHRLAVDYYQDCLKIAREAGDRWLEAEALSNLGFAHEGLQSFEKALDYYDQGLALFKEIDSFQSAAITLNNRAHTLFAWHQKQPAPKRLQAAEKDLRQSIEILEAVSANITTDADRISLFDTQIATYNLLQQVLIAQNKVGEALVASEEGRSRAFATLLQEKHAQSTADFTLADIKQFSQQQKATLVEYSIVPDDDFIHQGKARGNAAERRCCTNRGYGRGGLR